jgi:hypothetical protein
MGRSWTSRVKIPQGGLYKFPLYSSSGNLLAVGYTRIVFGGRGPYVEFDDSQILKHKFEIPKEQEYRLTNLTTFYLEYRSKDESYVKLYHQKKRVKYADYKIGMYYISPFDLYQDWGLPTIV